MARIQVLLAFGAVLLGGVARGDDVPAALAAIKTDYAAEASEVTQSIQRGFYLPDQGLYARSLTNRRPEFMWGNGVMFTALLGAARHDPATYSPVVSRFFAAMDRYWDAQAAQGGYEPAPIPAAAAGPGHNKYYDDNAWMVLAFTEAYAMTHDAAYLRRARATLDFVLSGWDQRAGGGIWWHEAHKDGSKNTCVNAPAALGCLRMAALDPPRPADPGGPDRAADVATARRIVAWTDAHLRAGDGLYEDRLFVDSGKIARGKLTYNTGVMIRAELGLYRQTGEDEFLQRAKASAAAGDGFLDESTGGYRDAFKWAHLMVEADLAMFRATGDEHLLRRAVANADFEYASWKRRRPAELIEQAAVARTLWLMADMQSPPGRAFWKALDGAAR